MTKRRIYYYTIKSVLSRSTDNLHRGNFCIGSFERSSIDFLVRCIDFFQRTVFFFVGVIITLPWSAFLRIRNLFLLSCGFVLLHFDFFLLDIFVIVFCLRALVYRKAAQIVIDIMIACMILGIFLHAVRAEALSMFFSYYAFQFLIVYSVLILRDMLIQVVNEGLQSPRV